MVMGRDCRGVRRHGTVVVLRIVRSVAGDMAMGRGCRRRRRASSIRGRPRRLTHQRGRGRSRPGRPGHHGGRGRRRPRRVAAGLRGRCHPFDPLGHASGEGVAQCLNGPWSRWISKCLGLFGARVVRRLCVSLKGLAERLGLGSHGSRARSAAVGQRAGRPRGRAKAIGEEGDKIRRKGADGPSISVEAADPPRTVAGVQTLNQVALNEAEVALGLPRCG